MQKRKGERGAFIRKQSKSIYVNDHLFTERSLMESSFKPEEASSDLCWFANDIPMGIIEELDELVQQRYPLFYEVFTCGIDEEQSSLSSDESEEDYPVINPEPAQQRQQIGLSLSKPLEKKELQDLVQNRNRRNTFKFSMPADCEGFTFPLQFMLNTPLPQTRIKDMDVLKKQNQKPQYSNQYQQNNQNGKNNGKQNQGQNNRNRGNNNNNNRNRAW